jgi:hypothetical protein
VERRETHDCKILCRRVTTGMKVVFVRFVMREKRNDVAATTGVAKLSYSSV